MNPHPRCPTCHRTIERSSAQNAMYWALMHLISERIAPDGNRYDAETWSRYFRSLFIGCDEIKLPDGRILSEPKTSKLDVEPFAEYLTKVEAWAAERGCYLEEKR